MFLLKKLCIYFSIDAMCEWNPKESRMEWDRSGTNDDNNGSDAKDPKDVSDNSTVEKDDDDGYNDSQTRQYNQLLLHVETTADNHASTLQTTQLETLWSGMRFLKWA